MSFCTISVQVRILSSLDHPSIIQYYGTATENTVHFIVTGLPNIRIYMSAIDNVNQRAAFFPSHNVCTLSLCTYVLVMLRNVDRLMGQFPAGHLSFIAAKMPQNINIRDQGTNVLGVGWGPSGLAEL